MRDFDRRRREFDRKFAAHERAFKRTQKWSTFWFVITWGISLGVLGFGIWVILLLLRHFGIL